MENECTIEVIDAPPVEKTWMLRTKDGKFMEIVRDEKDGEARTRILIYNDPDQDPAAFVVLTREQDETLLQPFPQSQTVIDATE